MRFDHFHDMAAAAATIRQATYLPFEDQYVERAAEKAALQAALDVIKQAKKPATPSKRKKVTVAPADENLTLGGLNSNPRDEPKRRSKKQRTPKTTVAVGGDPIDLFHQPYSLGNRQHIDRCLEHIVALPRSARARDALKNLIRRRLKILEQVTGRIGHELRRELGERDPALAAKLRHAIRAMLEMHEDLDFVSVSTWMTDLLSRLVRQLPTFQKFVDEAAAQADLVKTWALT